MGHIIDISHHQNPGKINYDKLSKEVDHIIIRTQYGSKTIDRYYKTHHREFKRRGIARSAYAWVRGISISDMQKEASDFYNRTKEFQPEYWFLDVEEKSMTNMRAGISAYIKKLRDLGVKKVGIYIGHHLYKSFKLNLDEVDCVWIPHYGRNIGKVDSKPSYPCDLHQYTSRGRLNGYNGNLDLNRIISNFNFVENNTYIVQAGDTLWGISKRFNISIEDLVTWNNIEDRNLILVGQVINLGKPDGGSNSKIVYRVKRGDTLSEIALRYHVRVDDIVRVNNLKDPNRIYVGDKLLIPNS